MIELSKTQKSVIKILKDKYNKDTVTRAEINALVKKKVIKNPSWLKSDKFKVSYFNIDLKFPIFSVQTVLKYYIL